MPGDTTKHKEMFFLEARQQEKKLRWKSVLRNYPPHPVDKWVDVDLSGGGLDMLIIQSNPIQSIRRPTGDSLF
jgi:hypothetical protein